MTGEQAVVLALGGLTLVCLVLMLVIARMRRAWMGDLRSAHAEVADVRRRLDDLEQRDQPPVPDTAADAYVITGLGTEHEPEPEPAVDPALFADIVLRETVVKAASLAHGVRRGLAPAARNRIRFEMSQEVRRARKQRRADVKAAQRHVRARQRATLAEDGR
jgi:hypothetical protein